MKVLLVGRAARFSPNSVERDRRILQEVADELARRGHTATCCGEDGLRASTDCPLVLSMARSQEALETLSLMEDKGTRVLNSASALRRLNRRHVLSSAAAIGVAVPRHAICQLPCTLPPLPYPFWWKRDDRPSMEEHDVMHITDDATWHEAIRHEAEVCVAEEHIEGELLKCYGVVGTPFFHTGMPEFSKFGREDIAHTSTETHINLPLLKHQLDALAAHVGLDIYGADVIVRGDGTPVVIDLNDWPSFSMCREAAARAIVDAALLERHNQ